jgi:phage-related protein
MVNMDGAKPLFWIASSRKDLKHFPEQVRSTVGFALWQAQNGGKHVDAKPLRGFGGAGVLEILEIFAGNTYRAVYTVKFSGAGYVLHAFQKKSKKGSRTPPVDVAIIRSRLKFAEQHYGHWRASRKDTQSIEEAPQDSR